MQTVSSASSEEPLTTTSSENESSTLTVVKGSTDGSSTEITDSEDFTLVALNNEFSSPQNSSEVEAGIEEGNTSLDNMVETTAPQLTSEDISQLRITTPVKFESTEAPSTVEDTTTVQMSAESTTTHLGDSGSTEEESGDSIDVEVTGKGVADKSELSDATTSSTEITTEPAASSEEEGKRWLPFTVHVEVTKRFLSRAGCRLQWYPKWNVQDKRGVEQWRSCTWPHYIGQDQSRGKCVPCRFHRGISSPYKLFQSKNSYTKLSLDNVDAVEIRPKLLFSRSKAHLFVKDPSLLTAPLKIKASDQRASFGWENAYAVVSGCISADHGGKIERCIHQGADSSWIHKKTHIFIGCSVAEQGAVVFFRLMPRMTSRMIFIFRALLWSTAFPYWKTHHQVQR